MFNMKTVMLALTGLGFALMAQAAGAADNLPHPPHPIPHPIEGYVPLTPDRNMCAMCHRENGKAPVANLSLPVFNVPASHYDKDGKLNGNRNNCVMCHAPMTEFSSFKPRDLQNRPEE